MPDPFPLSAIILAGGKSSRMGRDKALLPFGDETMLEKITALLNPIFEETLVIVDERSKTKDLKLGPAKVHEDLFQNKGPLAGIYTGLSYSKNKACCVFPCDMPFIDSFLILNLVDSWRAACKTGEPHPGFGREDMDALCFEDACGRLQPFPGIYSRSCRFRALSLLNQGEKSMQNFLDVTLIKPLILREEKMKVFMNMNTIEDYRCAIREKMNGSKNESALSF